METVSALETYAPLVGTVAFVGGWVSAMITGLVFWIAR